MNILYTTDGSGGSDEAARFLAALEHRDDVRVHILTVPASGMEDDQKTASATLAHASMTLGAFSSCVTTEVSLPANTTGEISERIVERAFTLPADLVVVGTHGRSGIARWFVGSVALNVVRHAPCPVLLARSPKGAIDRVLAGVDGSPCATYAIQWMLGHVPLPASSTVRLSGIVTLPALVLEEPIVSSALAGQASVLLEQEQERLQEALTRLSDEVRTPSLNITTDVRLGSVAGGLIEAAKDWEADLLIVGSHGTSGVERWLLGSVSEGVLQRSPCSVLVVRQPHKPESPEAHQGQKP
jgi:nucleotide-binding universal stress UspA family protein